VLATPHGVKVLLLNRRIGANHHQNVFLHCVLPSFRRNDSRKK
jgi:hypothetical protein